MLPHTLASDGDDFEKTYWAAFASKEFPSYAQVWEHAVKPLREHPAQVPLKDTRGQQDSATERRMVVAQLNYSTLLHLGRVYEVKQSPGSFLIEPAPTVTDLVRRLNRAYGAFASAIVGLSSATDTADELLERLSNDQYEAWSEKASKTARTAWRTQHNELGVLRRYRNRLVHGPALPSRHGPVAGLAPQRLSVAFPKFDVVRDHADWRELQHGRADAGDFVSASDLVAEAWKTVLDYLEHHWRATLLPLVERT